MKPVQKWGMDGVKALPREPEVPAEAARIGAPGRGASAASRTGRSRNPKEVTTISELANVCMSMYVCMYVCIHTKKETSK